MATLNPGIPLPGDLVTTGRSEPDNTSDDPRERSPLVLGDHDFGTLTDKVTDIALKPINQTPKAWYIAMAISLSLMGVLGLTVAYLLTTGVGVWGNNNRVAWGFDIINFVFWVGIGHAGTLISAILFLFRQNWRTSINRFAEAMTIFAVTCAGIYPALHIGRVWLAYWMLPYFNQMGMWPQARSPLLWDVFAVTTYATVSALFWYVGMVPDLATFRDRAKNRISKLLYGLAALGWNGSSRHWMRFERAYLLLAALATPLVLSVHSVVSFDFAVAQLFGWHTTIFPPYFVAGAVFGGFAMVITLAIPARQFFGLKDFITLRHLENMAKIMLGTGLIVAFAYIVEFFVAWYSGHHFEQFVFANRLGGPYWWAFAIMFFCNVIAPQALWFKAMRTNLWVLMFAAMCVNVGMWFERFVIIVTSLHRDYLPANWTMYAPTWVDIGMLAGSFGLFFTMFLLFVRFLPMVAMAEVKTVMPQSHPTHEGDFTGDYHGDYGEGRDEKPQEEGQP